MPLPANCRLCAKKLTQPKIVSDSIYGGKKWQRFYQCPHCQVAFLYPPVNEKEESRFYAGKFEKFMDKRAGHDLGWMSPQAHAKSNEKQYRRRLRFFSEHIAKDKRLLEIGCSSGFMILPLKEKGMQAIGIEPSRSCADYLVNKGIPVFSSLEELKKTPLSRRKFDLLLHFFVLEHLRNPIIFLKNCFKLLVSGGVMVFEVPSLSDPLLSIYNIPAFKKFYWSIAHNYYFNKESLEYVLKHVAKDYEIIPEQRYDLSNHMNWALYGKPGGQGKFSSFFLPELDKAYLKSMRETGHCDTFIVKIYKKR